MGEILRQTLYALTVPALCFEDSLLLLLELARCTEMCVELAGGSWIADLSVVTEHLVRNEVHPALARLGLPAKMLQNALKPAALRG